jgi:hypothetical protein
VFEDASTKVFAATVYARILEFLEPKDLDKGVPAKYFFSCNFGSNRLGFVPMRVGYLTYVSLFSWPNCQILDKTEKTSQGQAHYLICSEYQQ